MVAGPASLRSAPLMASSSSSSSKQLMKAVESKMEEWCVCVQGDWSQWTDQWKSLFGAYRLARSQCDGCVVAGNGVLQLLPEQTEMMNSDVFTHQQPVLTSSGSAATSGVRALPHARGLWGGFAIRLKSPAFQSDIGICNWFVFLYYCSLTDEF